MSDTNSRTNPYRFGVLEGNHAEDRFSLDLLAKQGRAALPDSTMKDHYRWFNSVLFEHRDEYLKRFPELAEHLRNNKSLKHHLSTPAHLVQQEIARTNKPEVQKQSSGEGPAGIPAQAKKEAKMFVCCSQGRAASRRRRDAETRRAAVHGARRPDQQAGPRAAQLLGKR